MLDFWRKSSRSLVKSLDFGRLKVLGLEAAGKDRRTKKVELGFASVDTNMHVNTERRPADQPEYTLLHWLTSRRI